jgi:enoyl-[acyl-carrier protein] reductase I
MPHGPRFGDALPRIWDPEVRIGDMLRGKRGLVIGITDEHSIAYGCATKLRALGAKIAVTYPNEPVGHLVRPLAKSLEAALILPLDVEQAGQSQAVLDAIRAHWGGLDFVIHSIALASHGDLQGRVLDYSLQRFQKAMHISCYSVIEMARLAAPLMRDGGSLVTLSNYGADTVADRSNIMDPMQAALEASVRSIAGELAPSGIRVYTPSPDPLTTRLADGSAHFDLAEIGRVVTFLVGGVAPDMSGDTVFLDRGLKNVA